MDGFLGPLGAFFRCAAEGGPGKAGGFAGERRSKEAGRGRPAEARGKADFATTPSGGHTFCSHRKYGERCAKGGTLWNPHKSGVRSSVVFYTKQCVPVAVKKPPVFCGPLIVRRTSCPISRRLPRSDNGGTAYSVRRWKQSEPDGPGPPGAILSARTESMEKDAPKGHGPFGIPTNLECLLLWFSTPRGCLPETVKKPPAFCVPLIVRCTSCPISRRLPRSDIGSTAYSVRRWEQSEPDGGG